MAADDVEKIREAYEHWAHGDWRAGTELFAEDLHATRHEGVARRKAGLNVR